MGRPSKLSEAKWADISRRLLAGEKAAALAAEFKVSRAVISQRFSKRLENVRNVANQLVDAEEALRSLPVIEQVQALTLADELRAISMHLAGAAKYGSATAHRLAGIAHANVQKIDDTMPMDEQSIESLRGIAALTRLANEAAATGINLLAANKDRLRRLEDAEEEEGSDEDDARRETLARKLESKDGATAG